MKQIKSYCYPPLWSEKPLDANLAYPVIDENFHPEGTFFFYEEGPEHTVGYVVEVPLKEVVDVSNAPERIFLKMVREDRIEPVSEEEFPEDADADTYCALDVPDGYFDDPIHRNTVFVKILDDGSCSLTSYDEIDEYGDILWYRKFIKAHTVNGVMPETGIEEQIPSFLIESTIGEENTLPCSFDVYGEKSYLEPTNDSIQFSICERMAYD